MPELCALQRQLAAEILGAVAPAPPAASGLHESLRLPEGVDVDTRLAVYRNGYPARLLDAMRDVFPAIANICGAPAFAGLTSRYVQSRDLSRTALNAIGNEFPDYSTVDPLCGDLPFLPDLVSLEWQVLCSFHACDLPPVDAARFAAWDLDDWDRAVLSFQPSVAVVRSSWPLCDLWTSRDTPRDEIDIDLIDRPQIVLVHRRGDDVECSVLEPTAALLLETLLGGATLGEAMQTLTALDDAGTDPAQTFAGWLGAGLIASVDLR